MSSIIRSRMDKIISGVAPLEVDGFLITNIYNVRYSTGFTGSAGNALLTPDKSYFLTDFRYKEQVNQQVTEYENVIKINMYECLDSLEIMKSRSKIAFEADHVSVSAFEILKEKYPSIEWVASSLAVERVAAIKDTEEIENFREACVIIDSVFTEICDFIKPGITENEISAEITYRSKMKGSEVDPFEPIIASGLRSALPHGISSMKQIEAGDFVVLDFGATIGGYAGDMTRTVVIGEPTEKHLEIYDIVKGAQQAGLDAARDGISGADLDAVARKYITDKGYGEFFGHALGHGLGLEVHSWPRVSSVIKEPLRTGMAITIEPGIYLPDFGGVRIEDDIVLTEDGHINLTGSTKELISL